jgi:hypothetical protein
MALREVFLDRVRDQLYTLLRDGSLKGWDTDQIVDFADAVLEDSDVLIDKYILTQDITLSNINASVQDIVTNILIPKIKIK